VDETADFRVFFVISSFKHLPDAVLNALATENRLF
jgi:hypothetical protein